MRVLAIVGSLRAGSFNRLLARVAAQHAPQGMGVEIWEGLADVPPYDQDQDTEPPPAAVAQLRAAIDAADGLLIATPEYNGSIPGQLKNALDWASRPFPHSVLRGKPVAVVGTSPSRRGARGAQAELRKVLQVIGADPLEAMVAVGSARSAFDADGQLTDAPALHDLRQLLSALHAYGQQLTA